MGDVLPKPQWLRIRPSLKSFDKIKGALRKRGLYTVCEEAHCPNMDECWKDEGTATFLLMGDVCTRACKFCNIKTAYPAQDLDPHEPEKISDAIAEMGLDYAVLTCVDRDDLFDQGATHLAKCISQIKDKSKTIVEILLGDFKGDTLALKKVVDSKPAVIAHNIETVKELHKDVRDPRAGYEQSLRVLRNVKEMDETIITKSSIMLGMGETKEQVKEAMRDLRQNHVDILTLGQYMRPSENHYPVKEYVHPDVFKELKDYGEEIGFKFVASGPFVRSSYRAGELFIKNILKK